MEATSRPNSNHCSDSLYTARTKRRLAGRSTAQPLSALLGCTPRTRQSASGPDPAVFKIGELSTSSAPGSPKEGSTLRLSLSPPHRAGWTVESRLSRECAWEGIARFHHTKTSRSTSRSASPSSRRIPKDCGILTSPVSRGSRKRSLVHFQAALRKEALIEYHMLFRSELVDLHSREGFRDEGVLRRRSH